MKKIFVTIFTLLMFLGCSIQKGTFILDNPTDTAIKTKVDGKEYNLGAGEYEKPGPWVRAISRQRICLIGFESCA